MCASNHMALLSQLSQRKIGEMRKDMKRKQNKSTKRLAVCTVVVVALVGISVFSLYSLANQKKDAGIKVDTVADANDIAVVAGRLALEEEAAPVEEVVYVPEVIEYEAPAEIVEVEEELVVVSSVVETTVVPEPVAAVIEDTQTVEEPVALAVLNTEPVFAETYEEPAYEEPVYWEPEYEEPVYEEPAYEEPVYEEPAYEEPVYWEPEYEEPVYEEPAYVEPVYEEPEYEEPVYEEPEYEEPVYEEPEYEEPVDEETEVPESTRTTVNPASSIGQQIVDFAASRVGVTPYVWAGRSLETGTDCSGFVSLVYDNFGYYASAASDDYQFDTGSWGTQISYDELMPGDVIVYRNGGHVGIYGGEDEDGNEYVIHDSNEIEGVKISDMFYTDPTAYVRILDDEDIYWDEDEYSEEEYYTSEEESYDYEESYYESESYEDYYEYYE